MRTNFFRLGFGLLLLAGASAFTACNKTCPGPRSSAKGHGCQAPTSSDSTSTTKSS